MWWRICLVVLIVIASACSEPTAPERAEPASTATPPATSAPTATTPVPAAPSVPEATTAPAPIEPQDFQLDRAIGVAEQHGLFFFPATPTESQGEASSLCASSTSFLAVDAAEIAGTVTLPGDQIYRVEFGPSDWGFAATRCGNTFSIVPLRIMDGAITAVTGPDSSVPVQIEGSIEFVNIGRAVESSVWHSATQIRLTNTYRPDGGPEILDLATGQRSPVPDLPLSVNVSPGERQLLATDATAPFFYYRPQADGSCGRTATAPAAPIHVVQNAQGTPVLVDSEPLRAITQLTFGPDGQVAWLTSCFGERAVWHATVDPETGQFIAPKLLVDPAWSLAAGWVSVDGWAIGPWAIAYDQSGSLVAWTRTVRGLEGMQLAPDLTQPTVIIASGAELPPQATTPPEVHVVTGAPSDIAMSELATPRPPGTAERNGLVFYGPSPDNRRLDAVPTSVPCADSVAAVHAFGDSSTPWHVANLRGRLISRFDVDRGGRLRAITTCDDNVYVSTGIFDFELMAIEADSLQVWVGSATGPQPTDEPSGQLRWGAYVLDDATNVWTTERGSFVVDVYKGSSDSGRFDYFAERGIYAGKGSTGDPELRVWVEDRDSDTRRPAFDDPTGLNAWRLIFGPDDQVAWMEGNELGTAAFLGRVDPTTGEIVDVQGLTHPYWGYPLSGSGDPGPDAIAFESDGRLRAWAFTSDRANPDESTWRVESLAFTLD